jgi:hypothetical protein
MYAGSPRPEIAFQRNTAEGSVYDIIEGVPMDVTCKSKYDLKENHDVTFVMFNGTQNVPCTLLGKFHLVN